MAKKLMKAKRQRSAKKAKAPVRAKSKGAPKKVAPRKATPKKPARKAASTAAKKMPSARKPSKSLSKTAPAGVERATTTPPASEPQAFWDPKGGQSAFTGDAKAHTKPGDQRAHIRMTAPSTWSNRQRGRG